MNERVSCKKESGTWLEWLKVRKSGREPLERILGRNEVMTKTRAKAKTLFLDEGRACRCVYKATDQTKAYWGRRGF